MFLKVSYSATCLFKDLPLLLVPSSVSDSDIVPDVEGSGSAMTTSIYQYTDAIQDVHCYPMVGSTGSTSCDARSGIIHNQYSDTVLFYLSIAHQYIQLRV